jgi:hypothetical protein
VGYRSSVPTKFNVKTKINKIHNLNSNKMTNSRTVQDTYLGGKFVAVNKGVRDYSGKLGRATIDVPIDQKLMPIYKIEGHNVNIKKLEEGRWNGVNNNVFFEVEYRLGQRMRETFVGSFIDATKDYRTLIFTHPTLPNMTIGVPIMNIYSCTRVDNK